MADRAVNGGGIARPVEQSVIDRASGALRNFANNLFGGWFSPLPPLAPVAPPDTQVRSRDYQTGENLNYTPRAGEAVSFAQMRALADGYDLLRLVIETRKDQVSRRTLKFKVKEIEGESKGDYKKRNATDSRLSELAKFFKKPDGEHLWIDWSRMLLEDMLVIDAASIHPRFTFGGDVYGFEVIDGATIHRVIDSEGRTPVPPLTAYQQILKGVPAIDLTMPNLDDVSIPQLVYRPRNIRVSKLYGYSPVEQIIMTVNIALRRQIHQLSYYTEGSVPDAIVAMPEDWTPDQIDRFMQRWDTLFAGNSAARRKLKFVPGPLSMQFTKDQVLKDEFDEWLARLVAFAFSIPPNALIKQMNRASGEQMSDDSMSEGLEPTLIWLASVITQLVETYFGYDDIEAAFEEESEASPDMQSQINDRYVRAGIKSIDEVRDELGLEPIGMPNAIITGTGPVLIDDAEAIREQQNAPDPQPIMPDGSAGSANASGDGSQKPANPKDGKPAADDGAKATKGKKKLLTVSAGERTRMIVRRERTLARSITKFFSKEKKRISREIVAAYEKTEKAADPERVEDILSKLNLDTWVDLQNDVSAGIEAVYGDAGKRALVRLNVDDASAVFDMIEQNAVDYANSRAAELVGASGGKWSITETTRKRIRSLVTQTVENGMTPKELADAIWEDTAFSPVRAEMISRTELATANVQGNLDAWKQSGVVVKKKWLLGSEHDHDDECDDNADDGAISIGDTFSSGDFGPPAHPNCVCDVVGVTNEDEE